jgi:hypothetical protein
MLYRAPLLLSLFLPLAACGPTDTDTSDESCSGILTGDLVITEIMANPSGEDNGNEYFEIYNNTSETLNLKGLVLVTDKGEGGDEKFHVMGEAYIEPNRYMVLGGVLPEFKQPYVGYGYGDDLGTMRNEAGLISMRCEETDVDTVIYGTAKDGRSLGFDGNLKPDHLANDDKSNFCDATLEFARSSFGSPGSANEPCSIVVQTTCNDSGTERDVVRPGPGDLVITELMPDSSAAPDDFGEWFEVEAVADVDLNGLVGGKNTDDPKMNIVSEDCLSVTAGTRILFARSADEMLNGGLPMPNFTFNFGLTNSGSTLFIGVGDVVVDEISWSSSSGGKSISLDPGAKDATSNDEEENWCQGSTPYGAGDLGTPGDANPPCDISGMCMDGGSLRPVNPPMMADVTITEVMPNPSAVSDTVGEWFEVHFAAGADLNGLQLGRSADPMLDIESTVTATDCITVTANSYVVFARNDDMTVNGGLPADSIDYDFALSQTGGTDYTLFVAYGGVLLDLLTYNGSDVTAGVSRQLDPDGDKFCDSTNIYNDPDTGSPGAANEECP